MRCCGLSKGGWVGVYLPELLVLELYFSSSTHTNARHAASERGNALLGFFFIEH